jgi:DNA primase
VRAWLEGTLGSGKHLPEEALVYLLGRGMREATIHSLGITLWRTPAEPCPDAEFLERYQRDDGSLFLEGRLTCPALSPRGDLLGFEGRTWRTGDQKRITDYRLPESKWNPFFLGLTSEVMGRIWNGADVYLVEGLFDLAALERVVPANAVVLATVRAKVSDTHVEFLRRYVRRGRVYVVYDNDETGRRQTHGWVDEKTGKDRWGALQRLERVGVSCQHVPYRGGKDPGVIWDQGGQSALEAAFSHII